MPEQKQSATVEPDPKFVIAHLKEQLSQKSEEAATNWAGMQQVHQESLSKDKQIEDLNTEIMNLRIKLGEGDQQELKLVEEVIG